MKRAVAAVCLAGLLLAQCGLPPTAPPRGLPPGTGQAGAVIAVSTSLPAPGPASPEPTLPPPAASATPSPAPPPSDTPTPSPSPTPLPPQPLSPDNAGRAALMERLGSGALQGMAWLPGGPGLPSGRGLVAAFQAGLRLLDPAGLAERQSWPAPGLKAGLAASPDGRHAALIAAGGVQLWDLEAGQVVHTLAAPSGGARLLAFGAGGRTLAVAGPEQSAEGTVEGVAVWDLAAVLDGSGAEARLLYRLEGFGNGVSGLAFTPDGARLLTARFYDWSAGAEAPVLDAWEAGSGRPWPLPGDLAAAPSGLQHLAFTPDGRLLAAAGLSSLYVWDWAGGALLRTFENESSADALALSPDGRWLAAGSYDRVARVWDLASGGLGATLAGHTAPVIGVAFDPAPADLAAARRVATATARDGVQVWDLAGGQRVAALRPAGNTDSVRALAYSPDGALLAAGSPDEAVWLWDADSGAPRGVLDAAGLGQGDWCACVWSLAFSPDGRWLATGATDARVRVWEVGSRRLLATSRPLGDLIFGVEFSPDGRRLAAGDADGNLWVWDTAAPLDGAPLLALDARGVIVGLAFDPAPPAGSYRVATGSGFGAIRVWDAGSGGLVREMQAATNSVRLAYTPDGRLLAAADGGWADQLPVRLWDPAAGELRAELMGHTHDVGGLAFSPDGRLLASGDWGGTIRLWDPATGELLQVLEQGPAVYALAFRPDGTRLASGGFDGLVSVWGVP